MALSSTTFVPNPAFTMTSDEQVQLALHNSNIMNSVDGPFVSTNLSHGLVCLKKL